MIKVGIVGLGLIGASILKALYKNNEYQLYCCSGSSYKDALNYTPYASDNLEIVKECDIVFVCSKVSQTIEVLNYLNGILNKETIVADVASIKKTLLNKKFNYNFILSHPMAGTEQSGFDAGFCELFVKAKWLIGKENKILEKIITDLGAIPFKIDMNQHDKMVAQISHLPTILSFLLFDSVDEQSKELASSGFRDMTRLAMTNSDLAFSMYHDNEENVLNAFNNLIDRLNCLKNLSDNEKISLLEEIAKKRAKMYDNNGKNIFKI